MPMLDCFSPPDRAPTSGLRLAVAVALAALLGAGGLGAPDARAQGFSVYEQGACAMGRGGTTVADGCGDGSSMFFNPANLAGMQGVTASVGATVVDANGSFTDDFTGGESELQNDPIPVPHGYLTYGVNERLAVGLGVSVPYGLQTVWRPTFQGAFEGYDNQVQAIYVQPTVSYRLTEKLRVGGGPILAVSSVELNQRLDLSGQPVVNPNTGQPIVVDGQPVRFSQFGIPFHTAFADANLEDSGAIGFGANVGATYDVSDRLSIGARYITPIKITYDGTASFDPVSTGLTVPADIPSPSDPNQVLVPAGTSIDALLQQIGIFQSTLSEQSVETEITFPAQFAAGVSYGATERLTLLADYQWIGWSSFDELPLTFGGDPNSPLSGVREENYDNTNAVHVGAEYDVSEAVTGRLGYFYSQGAAPDRSVTPLLPEGSRNNFAVGFGWRATDVVEVNLAYHRFVQNDRRGRTREIGPNETAAEANSGLYTFNANLFGATLTLHL